MSFRDIPIAKWWDTLPQKYPIGSGKSSTAYAVHDTTEQYIVRITPIHNPMQRMLILNEITMYTRIQQHPNYKDHIADLLYSHCPSYLSENETENMAFLIFPFRIGMPLDAFLKYISQNNFHLAFSTAQAWRQQLQDTLAMLDSLHIVHRDLKPANLFLDARNRLLLFDFEIACITSETTTDFRGTCNYATPEAVALLRQTGWVHTYTYTRKDDEHALETMFAKDIYPLCR
jgi:serine/threonine protein kinase